MDPLAHTLVGAAMAKSGLERRSRFAFTALVVGANLPDVDAVTYFVSADAALWFRRGWTHGLPAVALWPFLLAGLLVGFDRLLGSGKARFQSLLPLAFLAVSSHPALDWLNTYGMRWLMPIEDRWFYGDAVFIMDPWIWLLLGGALFLADAGGTGRTAAWAAGAIPVVVLVLAAVSGLAAFKALFAAGILALVLVRRFAGLPSAGARDRLCRAGLVLAAIYVAAMLLLARTARVATLVALRDEGIPVEELMVGPRPMTPLVRDVVIVSEGGFRYGTLVLWPRARLSLAPETLPPAGQSALGARALAHPGIRGFANWARFPWVEIQTTPDGHQVTLRDARYAARGSSDGFGTATVFLPRDSALSAP